MIRNFSRRCKTSTAAILASTVLLVVGTFPTAAQESRPSRGAPSTLFSTVLPDVPGTNLEVVELSYPPKVGAPSTPENFPGQGHHHPGSVYVFVTEGSIRIGVEGQPVTILQKGESFFEPPRAFHMFTESASSTQGARAIAVMLVPDGQPSVVRGRYGTAQ